jgi:hypothetical protein
MLIDLGPLLRRLVLASSPLVAGACQSDPGHCSGPPAPNSPFDFTVVVLDEPPPFHDTYVLAPTPALGPDAGVDHYLGFTRQNLSPELKAAYAECVRDHAQCGPFCRLVLGGYAVEFHTCMPAGGTAEWPMVRMTGLGVPPACGRRPPGFDLAPISGPTGAGSYLAACAALEAASVSAFCTVAGELEALGAPGALTAAALAAARDEVRHTRLMGALAARHGAVGVSRRREVRIAAAATDPRPLAAVACENAVEGCVRETFGALLAHLQARTAPDPVMRAVMARIAEDETRHANLAWDVDRWAWARLGAADRTRVLDARAAAVNELRDGCARLAPDDRSRGALGLPQPDVAATLVEELAAALWKTA